MVGSFCIIVILTIRISFRKRAFRYLVSRVIRYFLLVFILTLCQVQRLVGRPMMAEPSPYYLRATNRDRQSLHPA